MLEMFETQHQGPHALHFWHDSRSTYDQEDQEEYQEDEDETKHTGVVENSSERSLRICKAFQCILKVFCSIAKKYLVEILTQESAQVKYFKKFLTDFNK